MAQKYSYHLLITSPGGGETRDLTALVQSVTWAGDIRQTARELSAVLAVPKDGSVELPPLEEGAWLTHQEDGKPLFFGPLLQCSANSQSVLVSMSALDRGRFLVRNKGYYKFTGITPEEAAAAVCADFGIPVDRLAATGVRLTQNFPGKSLDNIIRTLYTLAGERNEKRYAMRFTGYGALQVVEKPVKAGMAITQTMGVVNTWSIEKLQNRVAIYTDDGALVRNVEDSASVRLNGVLSHVVVQKKGEDGESEAQAWLADHGLTQKLTVEVLDPRAALIAGAAVELKDTGSGVTGLFWVDMDTHTWKNGQHYGKFTLNFRNLTG